MLSGWIIANFENKELEEKAILDTIGMCMNTRSSQEVVNDALNSFRRQKVDESNATEQLAKTILIDVAKSKHLGDSEKESLVRFLVTRNEKNYEVDYSYIFDYPDL